VGDRETILGEIARQQAVLHRLEQVRERLRALEGSLGDGTPSTESVTSPVTSAEKIALFRRLFRGRDDVYPRYWENPRTGRRGYVPACANEWVRGVCEKPRVKCGDCPHQAFIAVSDQAVLDHLQGRHVVGVYPMLEDGRSWLLAVDFDKHSWADDVAAFVDTCRAMNSIPGSRCRRGSNRRWRSPRSRRDTQREAATKRPAAMNVARP
jgi:hypothetical protein